MMKQSKAFRGRTKKNSQIFVQTVTQIPFPEMPMVPYTYDGQGDTLKTVPQDRQMDLSLVAPYSCFRMQ